MPKVFTFIVLLMVLAMALAALSFGTILLAGELMGSFATAAFIVGGFYLLVFLILFLLRDRLFVNLWHKAQAAEIAAMEQAGKELALQLVRRIRAVFGLFK